LKVSELSKFVSLSGFYTTSNSLRVPVLVTDARPAPYNGASIQVEITPKGGSGSTWVEKNSVNFEGG
jgi:hypothetical protein